MPVFLRHFRHFRLADYAAFLFTPPFAARYFAIVDAAFSMPCHLLPPYFDIRAAAD